MTLKHNILPIFCDINHLHKTINLELDCILYNLMQLSIAH